MPMSQASNRATMTMQIAMLAPSALTAWATMPAALTECWLRVIGSVGNGIASPTIGRVALEFR